MRCAFVYPGCGDHRATMADVVLEAFPDIARRVFQQASQATGVDLVAMARQGAVGLPWDHKGCSGAAQHTPDAQALVYTVSVITHLGLLESGCRPDIVTGHQLGVYAALAAAGSLSFTDGLMLVREHAGLVSAPESLAEATDPEAPPAVAYVARPLLENQVERVELKSPYLPMIGSSLAQPVRTAAEVRQDIRAQIHGIDRWEETMSLVVDEGIDVVVEVGPGRSLTSLFAQEHPQVRTRSTADVRRIRRLIE